MCSIKYQTQHLQHQFYKNLYNDTNLIEIDVNLENFDEPSLNNNISIKEVIEALKGLKMVGFSATAKHYPTSG